MNERIRQLKQQARDFYLLQEDLDCSTKQLHELVESKFAELIIQDCMDVVDGYTKPRTFETHYDAVEQIEQLFGVKHENI